MKKILLFILAVFYGFPLFAGQSSREIQVAFKSKNHREAVTETSYSVHASPRVFAQVIREDVNSWAQYVPRYLFSRVLSQEEAGSLTLEKPKTFDEAVQLIGQEKGLVDQRIVKRGKNETAFYTLQNVDLPWPVSQRWCLGELHHRFDPVKNSLRQDYKSLVGNLVSVEGWWEVTPDPDQPGWSKVINYHRMDFGTQIPFFILRPFSRGIARQVHLALRKKAEQMGGDQLAASLSQVDR